MSGCLWQQVDLSRTSSPAAPASRCWGCWLLCSPFRTLPLTLTGLGTVGIFTPAAFLNTLPGWGCLSPRCEWVWPLWWRTAVFWPRCNRTPLVPPTCCPRTGSPRTRWPKSGGSRSRSACDWPRGSPPRCPGWATHSLGQQQVRAGCWRSSRPSEGNRSVTCVELGFGGTCVHQTLWSPSRREWRDHLFKQ